MLLCIAWFVGYLYQWFEVNKKETALIIETNSGSSRSLISKDKVSLLHVFKSVQRSIEESINEPVYLDLSQDRSIRIEGNIGGDVNSGDVNF